jgi:hypothetical protein
MRIGADVHDGEGSYHDRDHRRALQFAFSSKLPCGATGFGADPVKTFELFLGLLVEKQKSMARTKLLQG